MGFDITKRRVFTKNTNTLKDHEHPISMETVFESQYNALKEHADAIKLGIESDNDSILQESGCDLLKNMASAINYIHSATNQILTTNLKVINATFDDIKNDIKRIEEINSFEQVYFNIEGYEYTIPKDIPDFKYINDYVDKVMEDVLRTTSFTNDKAQGLVDMVADGVYLEKFRAKIIKEKYPLRTDSYSDSIAPKFRNGENNPIMLTIDTDYIQKLIKEIPGMQNVLKESIKQKSEIEEIISKYKKLCDGGDKSWYAKQVAACKKSNDGSDMIHNLNLYCNARCKEATSILNAVTLVYIEKFIAIKEAVQLYSYIFKMILSQYGGMPTTENVTNYNDLFVGKDIELIESYYHLLLEADGDTSDSNTSADNNGKKVSWIRKLIEVVKSLFDKFVGKNMGMIKNNNKWLADNKDKIKNGDYKNLTAKVYRVPGSKYIATANNDLKNMINELKISPNDKKLENIKSKEDVENYGAFKKFKSQDDKTFADMYRAFITGGSEQRDEIELSGNVLKTYCGTILDSCLEYEQRINGIQTLQRDIENNLRSIENELKKRGVSLESWLDDISSSYYIATEADGPENDNKNNNNDDKKEDMKVGQVINSNREGASDGSLKFHRWGCQLVQTALSILMTETEKNYIYGMRLLHNIRKELL